MKRIQTLGGLAVFEGTRPLAGNAQQPRRLATLAVLARAGDRGVNRDRLAALLWGEVEEERARRSLNQALYALRHDLGSEEVIVGTRELRLNPELVEVDVTAFETAKVSGALEEAARLYTGPFLGDFHLIGAPEFARWAEEERAALAADYRGVLEAVAAAATRRDDRPGAVLWWRRLAALDPADAAAAQGLMRALAAAGDLPGALRHAEIFEHFRREELELPPDPAVQQLAERIRRGEGVSPPAAAPTAEPAATPAKAPAPHSAALSTTPVDPAFTPRPRRRFPVAAAALLVALLVVVGALVASRGGRGAAHSVGPKRLAVLPFDNLGDSSDAYFADGVTDELRGRLAAVPGLEVVASRSSNEYRRTTKTLPQIAHDLGAGYLLVGKIRWQRGSAGSSRVRVVPELIRITPGTVPTTRWQQPFDAALTDVFQVQGDIATKVVDALDVVLADSSRRELMAKPTENLAAYDAFLKGEAAAEGMKGDQASLRRAISFYQRAVELDSAFGQAWSQLSRARTALYSNGVPDPELGEQARLAAEWARRLDSTDPLVYLALGDYYGSVNPIENERAMAEYEHGLRLAPNNVDLLGSTVSTETSLGRWDGVTPRLARASVLDPRSVNAVRRQASVNLFLRNYEAADSAADRAVALAPTNPFVASHKVLIALGRGELKRAQEEIRKAAERIGPQSILASLALYEDLYWAFDDEQQRQVLGYPVSAFDNDRAGWAMVRTGLYQLRGDRHRMLVYADSARIAFAEQARESPEDGQRRVLHGLALAYLGRKAEATREGQRGLELMPINRDGYIGPYVQLQLVRIYLLVGEQEKAMDLLEPLLRIPFYLSPGWLRIDPTFDPLRTNPRFRILLEGHAPR